MCYCDRTQFVCGHSSVKYAFVHPAYERNPSDCPEHHVFPTISTSFCQSCKESGRSIEKRPDKDKDRDKDKHKGKAVRWPWGKKEDTKGKAVNTQTGQLEDKGKGKGKSVTFAGDEAEAK